MSSFLDLYIRGLWIWTIENFNFRTRIISSPSFRSWEEIVQTQYSSSKIHWRSQSENWWKTQTMRGGRRLFKLKVVDHILIDLQHKLNSVLNSTYPLDQFRILSITWTNVDLHILSCTWSITYTGIADDKPLSNIRTLLRVADKMDLPERARKLSWSWPGYRL